MSTGGEAADQMVRMMLSGSEAAIRLSGSALKNTLALTMALAKQNKRLSGKVNMTRMLRETRDLRLFPMTPEQYQAISAEIDKLEPAPLPDIDFGALGVDKDDTE